MKKIVHQRQKCIGCGNCVAVCPKLFEMSEDGRAKLKNSKLVSGQTEELEIDSADEKCARDAEEGCPANCIHVEDK